MLFEYCVLYLIVNFTQSVFIYTTSAAKHIKRINQTRSLNVHYRWIDFFSASDFGLVYVIGHFPLLAGHLPLPPGKCCLSRCTPRRPFSLFLRRTQWVIKLLLIPGLTEMTRWPVLWCQLPVRNWRCSIRRRWLAHAVKIWYQNSMTPWPVASASRPVWWEICRTWKFLPTSILS